MYVCISIYIYIQYLCININILCTEGFEISKPPGSSPNNMWLNVLQFSYVGPTIFHIIEAPIRIPFSGHDSHEMYMDVSENSGTAKASILIGYSIINHPFWGTPIFRNTHIIMWHWWVVSFGGLEFAQLELQHYKVGPYQLYVG